MRRLIAVSLLVLGWTSVAPCAEVLREISWTDLKKAGQLAVGQLESGQLPAPPEQLKIDNPDGQARTATVLVVESPGITRSCYAMTGRVRYEGVQGEAYLEMWSHFPDGSHYFTRTLGRSGLLQRLEGSSPWRPFSLPFRATSGTDGPETLVVNVVLPGRGTVYLGPLRLVQYADDEDPLALPGAWWGDRTGGLIGGISGVVFGSVGGLIGILSGMGKARRTVLALARATCAAGILLLIVGVAALADSQPYAVWYPLVLAGILCSSIMGGMLPVLRRRYEQLELRRMTAMDAAVPGVRPPGTGS